MADGGFATLKGVPELPPPVARAIERHEFPPVTQLVWRNDDLDFSSIDALRDSLHRRPRFGGLRVVERADDHDALVQLARRPVLRERVRTPADVELLWEVCRVPDFRKLMLESHVELLAALFDQLSGPTRRIDVDWLATRMHRLDTTEGDIDALTGRIAFIRTWTYITHQQDWVTDAAQWQERARGIEDRCSDALHERLTERFVAREGASSPRVPRRRKDVAPRNATGPAAPPERDHPFARLRALDVPPAPGTRPDAIDWIEAVIDAGHDAITLDAESRLSHGGRALALLVRGPDILHPELRPLGLDEHGAGSASRIVRRLRAWVRDAVALLLEPVRSVAAESQGSARGLLYQLERGLGTLDGLDARAQIDALAPHFVARLGAAGIRVGREAVHAAAMATPALLRLRAALWSAAEDPQVRPAVPDGRALSVAAPADVDPLYFPHVGYVVRGPRAIRGDVLATLDVALVDAAAGGDEAATVELGATLGVRRRDIAAVVRALVD